MHICMCVYIYMQVMHECMYIYILVNLCVCVYIYTHVFTYICTLVNLSTMQSHYMEDFDQCSPFLDQRKHVVEVASDGGGPQLVDEGVVLHRRKLAEIPESQCPSIFGR